MNEVSIGVLLIDSNLLTKGSSGDAHLEAARVPRSLLDLLVGQEMRLQYRDPRERGKMY
jgi:hypothetical protein